MNLPFFLSGYYLFLELLGIWIILVLVLEYKGYIRKWNAELVLWIILMLRTSYGKNLLEKIARVKKFWTKYANTAIVVVIISMVLNFLILLLEAVIVTITHIPEEEAPTPSMLVGLPGINPFIPLGFGIIGLVIAMVIHEGAHGILTRVEKLKLKSLGLLMCIVPIGAFVEPDENELISARKLTRSRIYAVGPFTNIAFSLIFAIIFSGIFMGSVSPKDEGVAITYVVPDSPAANASLAAGQILVEVARYNISNVTNGTGNNTGNSTGNQSGGGDTVLENITALKKSSDLTRFLIERKPGEKIRLIISDGDGKNRTLDVVLASRETYTGRSEDNNTAFLGISYTGIKSTYTVMANPLGIEGDVLGGLLVYILLPLNRLSPVPVWFQNAVIISGPLSLLPEGVFWFLANCFYWAFWLNLMVGATNSLPLIPFDGGHIFKDGVGFIISRIFKKMKEEKRKSITSYISLGFTFLTIAMIIWLVVGPYVMNLLFW